MKHLSTPLAPAAVGTYSQGVLHGGIYYFSGQIGLDPKTMVLASGIDAQLEQILKNIEGLLSAHDLTKKNIIKTTIFMTDLNDFSKVNEAYTKFFEKPYPARSCVQVSALPKNSVIEIEVLASE
ncbi:Rid family detoxifying hydrolase [bacterium]|nr:Rid family detoxifying hydrolase [bacterium]